MALEASIDGECDLCGGSIQQGVHLLDLDRLAAATPGFVSDDGIHLTQWGIDRLAEILAEVIMTSRVGAPSSPGRGQR